MTQFLVKFVANGNDFLVLAEAANRRDAARKVAAAADFGQRTVTHVMKAPTNIDNGTKFNRANELAPYVTTADTRRYKRVYVDLTPTIDDSVEEVWVRDVEHDVDLENLRGLFHVFAVEDRNTQDITHWTPFVEVAE